MFYNIGSAEDGSVGGFYAPVAGGGDSIAVKPGFFPGNYAFKIDPVNGAPVTEIYGFTSSLLTQPTKTDLLLIPLLYRFEADFDQAISIVELTSSGAMEISRRVSQNTGEALQIFDKDEDSIGATPNGYVRKQNGYPMLWLVDVRNPSNTHDALWVKHPTVTVTDTSIAFVDGGVGADTITDSNNGFGDFTAGMEIVVTGDSDNNGTYTIVSVVAGTITLATGSLPNAPEAAGDSVSVDHTEQWYKAIDVSGHGDAGTLPIIGFNLGTNIGKGLPTVGGPFWIKNVVVQTLNETPNDTPLGSIITRFKVADGVNSTADDDFDAGVGAANPSHLNVDDVPKDDLTTYDEGDTQGDHQSYAMADADGGHIPLAIQLLGSAQQGTFAQPNVTIQSYIYDGSARDFAESTVVGIVWAPLPAGSTYNDINGTPVEDVTFNDLEGGVKITSLSGTSVLQFTQCGLEYCAEGTHALPDDFPDIVLDLPRRSLIGQSI